VDEIIIDNVGHINHGRNRKKTNKIGNLEQIKIQFKNTVTSLQKGIVL